MIRKITFEIERPKGEGSFMVRDPHNIMESVFVEFETDNVNPMKDAEDALQKIMSASPWNYNIIYWWWHHNEVTQ